MVALILMGWLLACSAIAAESQPPATAAEKQSPPQEASQKTSEKASEPRQSIQEQIQAMHSRLHRLVLEQKYVEAIQVGRKLVRIKDRLPYAHNDIGHSYYMLGNFPAALEHFRKAAIYESTKLEFKTNVGMALEALGRKDEAEKTYREAAEAGHLLARVRLGRLKYAAGDLQAAEKELSLVLKQQPKHPGALQQMSRIRFSQKDRTEAARYAREAIDAGYRGFSRNYLVMIGLADPPKLPSAK